MSGEPWTSGIDLNPHHEDIRSNRDTFDFVRAGYRWPGLPRGHRCGIYTPDAYVSPRDNQLVSDDPQRDRFVNTVDCGEATVDLNAELSVAHSNAFSADLVNKFTSEGGHDSVFMTTWYNGPLSIRWTGFLSPLESGYYAFIINASDGVRVFLDGIMLDKWVWYVTRDFRFSSGRPKSAAEAGLTLLPSLAVFCILTTQGRSRGGIQAAWHHASVV